MAASLTDLATLVDFSVFPEEIAAVAQMVAEGWTHPQIAEEVGRTPGWVGQRVAEIRAEIIRQVLELGDQLPSELRGRVEAFAA